MRQAPRSTVVMAVALAVCSAVLVAACSSPGDVTTSAQPSTVLSDADQSSSSVGGSAGATIVASQTVTTASRTTTPSSIADATDLDAAGIAAAITAAERGIRDRSLGADEVARWGRSQQRAYRVLAGQSELDDVVRALLPDDAVAPFDANVGARRAVVDHATAQAASTTAPAVPPDTTPPVQATLPAWTIVEPLPIDALLGDYREAEQLTGVPWQYLAAINLVETRMGRIVGTSSAGAVGPMQFLPSTWSACCTGDITDPHDAIVGAAEYLRSRGAPGDMAAAIHGYNPNDGYVGAVQAYAYNLTIDPQAYAGYHAWEVYVTTPIGTVRLPVGYSAAAPVDAAAYIAGHPDDVVPLPISG